MKIAPASRSVARAVERGVAEYGASLRALLRGRVLLVASNGRRAVSVAPRKVGQVLRKLKREPYCAGLEIGELRRGRFRLGLEGAYLIAGRAEKYVRVNQKGEQLVLYGRDVFIGSVVEQGELNKGDPCLILNERGEALAIGRVEGEGEVFVANLRDRGMYLRKGE
ncbi:MAG: hypothetical protein GXO66_03625 [Euryarchaeota archaeon]|nr:hypothetical protein [Euryarchaeota archaeon]